MKNFIKHNEITLSDSFPDSWEACRLKDICNIATGQTPPRDDLSLFSDVSENSFLWVKPENLNGTTEITETSEYISQLGLKYIKVYDNNSIILSGIGDIGKIGISSKKFTTNQQNHILYKIKGNYRYLLYYLIASKKDLEFKASGTVVAILNAFKLKNIFCALPQLDQQTKIVSYLDQETSKIDRKISILEQKYEKLEEYKQSVIFETVTKGLDSNVEMKDSGIDWIGVIPNHWEILRLKDSSIIKKGESFDEKLASADGIYPYINGGINPSDWSNYFNTKENTIAVSEGGASAGYTQFMATKYWAGSHCYKIQSKNKNSNNKYLFYILKGFEKYLMIEKTGSAMPNLQKTKFINYLVSFVNDIEEQNKIVNYLDNKTTKINKQKEIIQKKIELLKEYKQTIIYEAVTGKFKVEN